MANMTRNVPISIDDELLAEIDRVAERTKESRSAVMRRAIREGLSLAESGGGDALKLDGETSRDVEIACKEAEVSRAKFLIEAIRAGTQATYYRLMRDKWIRAQDKNPKDAEAESMIQALEHSMMTEDPMGRELRAAIRQRGAALTRFHDLLIHVPEAWRRYELVEKLAGQRKVAGAYAVVWGAGLSTDEIEWQIRMTDKHGASANWPEKEIKAHDKAREREDHSHRNKVGNALHGVLYPEK